MFLAFVVRQLCVSREKQHKVFFSSDFDFVVIWRGGGAAATSYSRSSGRSTSWLEMSK